MRCLARHRLPAYGDSRSCGRLSTDAHRAWIRERPRRATQEHAYLFDLAPINTRSHVGERPDWGFLKDPEAWRAAAWMRSGLPPVQPIAWLLSIHPQRSGGQAGVAFYAPRSAGFMPRCCKRRLMLLLKTQLPAAGTFAPQVVTTKFVKITDSRTYIKPRAATKKRRTLGRERIIRRRRPKRVCVYRAGGIVIARGQLRTIREMLPPTQSSLKKFI